LAHLLTDRRSWLISGFLLLSTAFVFSFGLMAVEFSLIAGAEPIFAQLATQLGISQAAAGLAIDLISGGAGVWSVVAAVAGLSGAGLIAVGGISAVRAVIRNQGRDFAVSW
jgi:circularin A/uberolysin family circular bacteriocin